MRNHHKESINNYLELVKQNKNNLAVVLMGSLAKGLERENSDIDVFLVVNDEEFDKLFSEKKTCYCLVEPCNYAGGYIDVVTINKDFLKKVVKYGCEPAKAAFEGAVVLWSKDESIENLVKDASLFDESTRVNRLFSYYAQVFTWSHYFYDVSTDLPYLRERSISEMIHFSMRFISLFNRFYFSGHKNFYKMINKADKKPENYELLTENLLKDKSKANVDAFFISFDNFARQELDIDLNQMISIYAEDVNDWAFDKKYSIWQN